MSKKIEITEMQAKHFNRMLAQLKKIAKDYSTPDQLRRQHERGRGMGPSYEEELEMAYENIQNEAAFGAKGISPIKLQQFQPLTNDKQ